MTIIEHIQQWAQKNNLLVQTSEIDIIFQTDGDAGQWISRARAIEEDGMIFVLSAYPFHVAPEKRAAAALTLGEINSNIKLGSFYLDPADGQINFRLGQFLWPMEDEETAQRVENMIMLALSITNNYYRKMMALALEE